MSENNTEIFVCIHTHSRQQFQSENPNNLMLKIIFLEMNVLCFKWQCFRLLCLVCLFVVCFTHKFFIWICIYDRIDSISFLIPLFRFNIALTHSVAKIANHPKNTHTRTETQTRAAYWNGAFAELCNSIIFKCITLFWLRHVKYHRFTLTNPIKIKRTRNFMLSATHAFVPFMLNGNG